MKESIRCAIRARNRFDARCNCQRMISNMTADSTKAIYGSMTPPICRLELPRGAVQITVPAAAPV